MTYKSIHTAYGLRRIAEAEAAGVAINLTHMAVGDGNGNPVEPSDQQSHLVRERFRAPINRVYQHPDDPGRFTAELIIPATMGGFTFREVGVFDDAGGLFVVGNLPDVYKPHADEGAFADTVVRVEFVVSNAEVITLVIDPNVAVATQQWIQNTITVCYLLPGGTTGQILKKVSNDCGDVEWGDPDVANVVVDMIEERQELVADQTRVSWSTVTNRGLAVYLDGIRLTRGAGADEWDADPLEPDTDIILGKSYPAGTQIVGVQNEPTGSVPYPLERDRNLDDVPDKPQARANLGVYSKEESDHLAPAGLVAYFARDTAPTGWLKANGALVSRTAYPRLFAAIGTRFGAGDGFNTFRLPDLRGEFVRGWDDGRGLDASRGVGTIQGGSVGNHEHVLATSETVNMWSYPLRNADDYVAHYGSSGNDPAYRLTRSLTAQAPTLGRTGGVHSGAGETRPRNIALLACIRY